MFGIEFLWYCLWLLCNFNALTLAPNLWGTLRCWVQLTLTSCNRHSWLTRIANWNHWFNSVHKRALKLKKQQTSMLRGTFQVLNMRWWIQKLLIPTATDMIDLGNKLKPFSQHKKCRQTVLKVDKKVTNFWGNNHLEKYRPYDDNEDDSTWLFCTLWQNLKCIRFVKCFTSNGLTFVQDRLPHWLSKMIKVMNKHCQRHNGPRVLTL